MLFHNGLKIVPEYGTLNKTHRKGVPDVVVVYWEMKNNSAKNPSFFQKKRRLGCGSVLVLLSVIFSEKSDATRK